MITRLNQKDAILEYIKEYGSFLPAKMSGRVYKDVMFGSEVSKRCRELRKKGEVYSKPDPQNPKFERFYPKSNGGLQL